MKLLELASVGALFMTTSLAPGVQTHTEINTPKEQAIYLKDRLEIRKKELQKRQHINVGNLTLNVIPSDTFECGKYSSTDVDSEYCPQYNQIVISRSFINFVDTKSASMQSADKKLEGVLFHEVGHAIQTNIGTTITTSPAFELQADCYAGQGMEALDPHSINIARSLYNVAAAEDPTHGTHQQRKENFTHGAKASDCSSVIS